MKGFLFMSSIRTDLAIERQEMNSNIGGVATETTEHGGIKVTRAVVSSGEGERNIGKPAGRYITIEAPQLDINVEVYEQACRTIAAELRNLIDINDNSVILIVGLGNDRITPDALGPDTVKQIMVTHHIKKSMPEILDRGIRSVCAVAPGVLGTTGMETVELVKGTVNQLKPDVVIAVDALASRSLQRIGCTVQICDTGISPGAGVGNRRDSLDEKTLGTKVIAVGVPTVTDAATCAIDVLSQHTAERIKDEVYSEMGALVLTPKNIDLIIEKASKTVANGINMALHEDMTFEYIESYVG